MKAAEVLNDSLSPKPSELPSKRHRQATRLFTRESRDIYGYGSTSVEPYLGMVISKEFVVDEEAKMYKGTVVAGPTTVVKEKAKDKTQKDVVVTTWQVRYEEDGDEEDLERDEILRWLPKDGSPKLKKKKARLSERQEDEEKFAAGVGRKYDTYDAAKERLMKFPGVNEEEITAALDEMQKEGGKPFKFGLQRAMLIIQRNRDKPANDDEDEVEEQQDQGESKAKGGRRIFRPHIGMRVRKMFNGATYYGTVTKDAESVLQPSEVPCKPSRTVQMWEVTYDDGEKDDMPWDELFQCRADRPVRTNPVRGRQLHCLEMFSGCGMVSQEFAERRWIVRSIDTDRHYSNATDIMSIMSLVPPYFRELGFIPDFIWASPPCFTYSIMAAGRHRTLENGEYEKTADAIEHNHIFVKMAEIMQAARNRNPHLIAVIENPVGLMSKMPLMKQFEESFGLHRVAVNYCAFGRDDKKPTNLWTNDFGLAAVLGEFTCKKKCPYYNAQSHPLSSRGQTQHRLNYAAIPQALAEEVAEYVSAKFYMDRIRHTKAPEVHYEGNGDSTLTPVFQIRSANTGSQDTTGEQQQKLSDTSTEPANARAVGCGSVSTGSDHAQSAAACMATIEELDRNSPSSSSKSSQRLEGIDEPSAVSASGALPPTQDSQSNKSSSPAASPSQMQQDTSQGGYLSSFSDTMSASSLLHSSADVDEPAATTSSALRSD